MTTVKKKLAVMTLDAKTILLITNVIYKDTAMATLFRL